MITFIFFQHTIENVSSEWVDNDFKKCDRPRCYVLIGLAGTGMKKNDNINHFLII